jgi:hypothetical protein
MDPFAPINGISLERYAELGALVSDHVNDQAKVRELVEKEGVRREDWDAAVAGWTARMQDMRLMGAVAMRYMPLYQAALQRRAAAGHARPAPEATFDDYVAMSGFAKARGIEAMWRHYGIDSPIWTQIAMTWNQRIPTDPRYMMFGMLVEQEGARIAGGGQPRPVSFPAAAAAPAPAAAPPPKFDAPTQKKEGAIGGVGIGASVKVKWADGNFYAGEVKQAKDGHYLIGFPNGSQTWVSGEFVYAG